MMALAEVVRLEYAPSQCFECAKTFTPSPGLHRFCSQACHCRDRDRTRRVRWLGAGLEGYPPDLANWPMVPWDNHATPGVYAISDPNGVVVRVGKSMLLKQRVGTQINEWAHEELTMQAPGYRWWVWPIDYDKLQAKQNKRQSAEKIVSAIEGHLIHTIRPRRNKTLGPRPGKQWRKWIEAFARSGVGAAYPPKWPPNLSEQGT